MKKKGTKAKFSKGKDRGSYDSKKKGRGNK